MWQGSYTLIHRANLGISKISAMSNLSQESKQDALAQLCFLKAWAYFNLVRNYGPVPIFRKSISEGEAMSQPRASVSDVYAHIIELLEQAEGMYSKDDAGFVVGHASNGAAKALLAKVYVTMASGAMSGVPIVVKGGDRIYLNHNLSRTLQRLLQVMSLLIRPSIMRWHVTKLGR